MDAQVLVLDVALQPVSRISWETAFKLLMTEKIEVVKYYKDKVVNSARKEWKVPAVVKIITGYLVTNKKRIKFSRENVYARDHQTCQYCGVTPENRRKLTWDHVKPRAQGGTTKWDNVITACFSCNQRKGARTPEQAGMLLRTKPVKPTNLPIILNWLTDRAPPEWQEVIAWFK